MLTFLLISMIYSLMKAISFGNEDEQISTGEGFEGSNSKRKRPKL